MAGYWVLKPVALTADKKVSNSVALTAVVLVDKKDYEQVASWVEQWVDE